MEGEEEEEGEWEKARALAMRCVCIYVCGLGRTRLAGGSEGQLVKVARSASCGGMGVAYVSVIDDFLIAFSGLGVCSVTEKRRGICY